MRTCRDLQLLCGMLAVLCGNGCFLSDGSATNPDTDFNAVHCPKYQTDDGIHAGAECGSVSVPLDWSAPQGKQIQLFTLRYRAPMPSKGQLWLLDGGPGGTGLSYARETFIKNYLTLGYDIYIPSHRGTGNSSALVCNATSLAGCAAELVRTKAEDLAHFRSDAAGHDLGYLIQRYRGQSTTVNVLGISYGTYWAQRYLQAYPKQPSAVVLEGILALDTPVWEGDPLADKSAQFLLDSCTKNAKCRAELGENPGATVDRVLQRADAEELRCLGPQGPDRADVRVMISDMLLYGIPEAALGVVVRLDRCNASDQEQLQKFRKFLSDIDADNSVDLRFFNPFLSVHVVRADLLSSLAVFPGDSLRAKRDPLRFELRSFSIESLEAIYNGWPSFTPPNNTAAATDVPMLLLNGGLDLQTPQGWAEQLKAEYPGENRYYFVLPSASHFLDGTSALDNGKPCSIQMVEQFLANPRVEPVSCVPQIPALDVAGTGRAQRVAAMLFGVASLFNEPAVYAQAFTNEDLEPLRSEWLKRIRTERRSRGHLRHWR